MEFGKRNLHKKKNRDRLDGHYSFKVVCMPGTLERFTVKVPSIGKKNSRKYKLIYPSLRYPYITRDYFEPDYYDRAGHVGVIEHKIGTVGFYEFKYISDGRASSLVPNGDYVRCEHTYQPRPDLPFVRAPGPIPAKEIAKFQRENIEQELFTLQALRRQNIFRFLLEDPWESNLKLIPAAVPEVLPPYVLPTVAAPMYQDRTTYSLEEYAAYDIIKYHLEQEALAAVQAGAQG